MKLEVETRISARPEDVFACLVDIPRWPETIAAIKGVELLTDGDIRVGTRFRERRVMFGREAAEEMEVVELVPPRRLVLAAESHGTRYRAVHLVEADGEGARLKLVFEATPITFLAWLLTPLGLLMQKGLKTQLSADFADIKSAVEKKRGV